MTGALLVRYLRGILVTKEGRECPHVYTLMQMYINVLNTRDNFQPKQQCSNAQYAVKLQRARLISLGRQAYRTVSDCKEFIAYIKGVK